MFKYFPVVFLLLIFSAARPQGIDVPKSYSNIFSDPKGNLILTTGGTNLVASKNPATHTLKAINGNISITNQGIFFDFDQAIRKGTIYYGFIPYGDSKHPMPVYFRQPVNILDGKAFINLMVMKGRYDMIGWQKRGAGTLGYRLVNEEGQIIYDGKISFKGTTQLELDDTIIEGPVVSITNPTSAYLSVVTNFETEILVEINNHLFKSEGKTHHEIELTGLEPNRDYPYRLTCGRNVFEYSLHTAPLPGTRKPFVFAYASDSRSGQGGGERDIFGANAYIMKKIMALATFRGASFMQFTGDMVTGYKSDPEEINLEYANWKRAIEPWAHYIPVYTGMGNHEALMHVWVKESGEYFAIDKFPFQLVSSEKIYGDNFINPINGPESEDGSEYDPDKRKDDFPSYKENVYYHIYDNVAMVVLNSDYWYSPSTSYVEITSGNIHGYIMDNQLKWLRETLHTLENDNRIDHVFITVHTPLLPNGGHVSDAMWYNGDNKFRPYINGKPVKKGIIERRDEILDLAINHSKKTIAFLTGDEHNYCRVKITPETILYSDKFTGEKIKPSRVIYHINNGAAGAPYYAQENTPWTPFTSNFTTQNALVFFSVSGKKISMEVLNPDTLEKIDELILRE